MKKKKIDGDHLIMVYTIVSRSPPLSRHHAINTSPILILELLTSKRLLITTSNLLSYHRRRLNITSVLLKWLLTIFFLYFSSRAPTDYRSWRLRDCRVKSNNSDWLWYDRRRGRRNNSSITGQVALMSSRPKARVKSPEMLSYVVWNFNKECIQHLVL